MLQRPIATSSLKNIFSLLPSSFCSIHIRKSDSIRNFQPCRFYSTNLTHVNENGKINMVDISSKSKTIRRAEAEAVIHLGPTAFQLVKENKIKKGDVIATANIAGIMAAKRTSELVPLCHSISIDSVKLDFILLPDTYEITIKSSIKTVDKTGAEMEALISVSIAALTIYDMCKAVTKEMMIKCVRLTLKSGGKENYKL